MAGKGRPPSPKGGGMPPGKAPGGVDGAIVTGVHGDEAIDDGVGGPRLAWRPAVCLMEESLALPFPSFLLAVPYLPLQ